MTKPESIPFIDSLELALSRVFEVYLPTLIFPFFLNRYLQNNEHSRIVYGKIRNAGGHATTPESA